MSLVEQQNVVVLATGRSSTAYEIHRATQDRRLPRTRIAAVITDRPDGGQYFRRNPDGLPEVPVVEVFRAHYPGNRQAWAEALAETIKSFEPDIVGQYGWRPLTPTSVLEAVSGAEWINQHPGPVDPSERDFGGKGMSNILAVCEAVKLFGNTVGRRRTNVTAQQVGPNFDSGKVLKRSIWIPFEETDDTITIASNIGLYEKETQIALLQDYELGVVMEQPPHDDLVYDRELPILDWAKREAVGRYP